MLFNNPRSVVASLDGGDGTYLHTDIVLQRIVEKLTPPTIYANNREMIDAFSQTLVNYSPVSINIMDFWNKRQLSNIVMPLKDSDFDTITSDKIYIDETSKGFFINSIKDLQERLAQTYLNNFYTTAYKVRNSHTLRQKLYQIFNSFGISVDEKNLLFNNINVLFKEERFITSKDYNMKKGKKVALTYAALSAHEAEIEGPLTAQAFFLDYEEIAPLQYSVESVLLPDVYNAFVKPLAHPLGLGLDYKKVCINELTDRVFNRIRKLSDGVTVKCTHPSDTLPTLPPPVLLPYIINPDYIDEETTPDIERRIPDLPYEAAVQNTENIYVDEVLTGPWDPANQNPTPEMYFASIDGFNLWEEIAEIDEGEGNTLEDIQYGYGDEEYAGMNYTKYIFANGAYLIEYTCILQDKSIQRIIEYYRFDLFNTSIHLNTVDKDETLPKWAYPELYGKSINIVHGLIDDIDTYPDGPLKAPHLFTLEDGTPDAGGYDVGVWGPLGTGYPTTDVPRIILNTAVSAGTVVNQVTTKDSLNYTNILATAGQTTFTISFSLDSVSVYVDGVKVRETVDYTISAGNVIFNAPLSGGDWVNICSDPIGSLITDYTASSGQTEFNITPKARNVLIFKDGIKVPEYNTTYTFLDIYGEVENNEENIVIETKVVFTNALTSEWIQIIENPIGTDEFSEVAASLEDTFNVITPAFRIQVYVDGIKLMENQYEYINDHEFLIPGSYSWPKNTNIITTEPQFTSVYSLVARFISTRECIINVYNLRDQQEISIREEFDIRTIRHQENIVHINQTEDTNIIRTATKDGITTAENVVNKYQKTRTTK